MISDDQAVNMLQDIIRIKTENDNEEEVAIYLQKVLKDNDIDSELVELEPGRSNLIAEIKNGDSDKILGISGHMDVVKAGDRALWDHDPYGAEIVDGKLYGRGSTDMKGGLMALITAMVRANEEKSFNGTIRLLATVGEETGEPGARQLSDLGYAVDLDGILVAEPFNNRILYMHGGSYNYKIKSHGISAHSSTPQAGNNAIHNLRDFMVVIQEKIDEIVEKYENEKLGRTIHSVTLIDGGVQLNSIPEYAEYQANARTIPEFGNNKLTQLLEDTVAEMNAKDEKYQFELEVLADMPTVTSNPDSDLIQVIHDVSHQDNIDVIALPGTTDTAQFQRTNPDMDIAIYGPGDVNIAHQINEFIEVDDYLEFIPTFVNIFKAYLK